MYIMSVFQRIKDLFSESPQERTVYNFTDEDRDKAIQVRKAKQQTQIQKEEFERLENQVLHTTRMLELKARLEEAKQNLAQFTNVNSGEDSSMDNMLVGLLTNVIQAKGASPAASEMQSIPQNTAAGLHLSDEDIKKIVDELPKTVRKFARNAPQNILEAKIKEMLPTIDQDSMNRAINYVKS